MVEQLEKMEVKGTEGKTGKDMLDAIVEQFAVSSIAQSTVSLEACNCVSVPTCTTCKCMLSKYGDHKPSANYGKEQAIYQ